MTYRDENEALRARLAAMEEQNRELRDAAARANAQPPMYAPPPNARPWAMPPAGVTAAAPTGIEAAAKVACVLGTAAVWATVTYFWFFTTPRHWRSPHSFERQSAWFVVGGLVAIVLLADALVAATLWQRLRAGVMAVVIPAVVLFVPVGGLIGGIVFSIGPFRGHVGGGGRTDGATTTTYESHELGGLRYFVAFLWVSVALGWQAILFAWSVLASG